MEWYRELKIFMDGNPSIAKKIKSKIPSNTLGSWIRGRTENVDNLPRGTRAYLYKMTQLETFNFEGYIDPDSIDIPVAVCNEESRDQVGFWIDYHGISRQDLANDAGVNRSTVQAYLRGKGIRAESENKIRHAILGYSAKEDGNKDDVSMNVDFGKTKVAKVEIPVSTQFEGDKNYQTVVRDLVAKVEGLSRDVQNLGHDYEPSPKERINIIVNSVDSIVEHLGEYFVDAPQKDREELAKSLDVDLWGWMINVMGGITKREGIPESFARALGPPKKKKRRNRE